MHIADIAQNSIEAKATFVEVTVDENPKTDLLRITVSDNGVGMSDKELARVNDPFFTTRMTRRIGLGIPLFREAALATGGKFSIKSKRGEGTAVCAEFVYSHIDRQPIGNIGETVLLFAVCNPDMDFVYTHSLNEKMFIFDTREVKKVLDDISISEARVAMWLKNYINEGITNLYGGANI